MAYQGYGRSLGSDRIRDLSLWATGGLVPDLTILLDVDPAVGLGRVADPDRLESEPLAWHRSVRDGFLAIAAENPERYLVLDASRDIDDLAQQISRRVLALLGAR